MGKLKQKKNNKVKFLNFKFLFLILVVLNSYSLQSAEDGLQNLTFNFKNADLDVVVKNISEILKKPIIVDPKIKGKITLISSGSIKRKRLFFYSWFIKSSRFRPDQSLWLLLVVKDTN